jgi:hypothetical protein
MPSRARLTSVLEADLGLLRLGGEVDDGFGAVVPAPRHVVAVQVHAADPPVDAVEGDLVGLTGQYPCPGAGQAHAGRPLHRAAGRIESEQRVRPGRPVQRTTGVRLTAAGARVLAGQADQIALNGIDRWIGGVHLQGHRVPWRWDDGTETIVHVPDKT